MGGYRSEWKIHKTGTFVNGLYGADRKGKIRAIKWRNLHKNGGFADSLPDSWGRMKRMQGYNVFHPMGYDSFGLPAEQYAVSTGNHPNGFTQRNIETFGEQWSKMIATSDPKYYKWTQWIFKQLYKDGYAKYVDMPVNWCEELGTVLSNDEIVDGKDSVTARLTKRNGEVIEEDFSSILANKEDGDKVKAFVWSDFDTMVPFVKSYK